MGTALRYILWLAACLVLSFRYRLRVRGLSRVRGVRGALILPNHPGYMDPPNILRALWPTLKPRPMLTVSVFASPLLFWLPKAIRAIELPDLDQPSVDAREKAQRAIDDVVAGLQRGENLLMWPSGRLQTEPYASLGGARALTEILKQAPDAAVIAVRMRGLWGSRFTTAWSGGKPALVKNLIKGAGLLLASALLFMPRRELSITVERIDRSRLPELEREKVNRFFEAWYNAPGPERARYVPVHPWWGPRDRTYPPLESEQMASLESVKPDVRRAVADILAQKLSRDADDAVLHESTTSLDELGLDSLDRMEMSLEIERRFGFSADQSPATIGQLWALASGQVESSHPAPPPKAWAAASPAGEAKLLDETIARAFLKRVRASGGEVAAADDMAGAVTYRRLLMGAMVVAGALDEIDNPRIGVMLPASVASTMTVLAVHLRGRTPVMMNWTTGPANLRHAVEVTGLTHILTSRRFIDRTNIQIEGARYIYLEDIRQSLSLWTKLKLLLTVRFGLGGVESKLPQSSLDDHAAILFTSGSEKAPKAAPLTQRNVLSNLTGALEAFSLDRTHRIIGFLPAFHSFGLTATTLLPVLTGIRIVYHPDPTDAGALARKIAGYRPTILISTPTFLSHIAQRSDEDTLESLKLIVVGAEKCPQRLFEKMSELAPGAVVLEGYGITECSPVVSANTPDAIKEGTIGRPLPGVEVRIADPEDPATQREQGEQGMILVAGPNIFPGYIAHDGPAPFVEADGRQWYVTGDLGWIDDEGFLVFAGRLKRFLKAGGEMISLPAIEAPLADAYPPGDDGPRIAVEGVETDHGRHITLFTTETGLDLAKANKLLTDHGLHGVMRLDSVEHVEQIPVLGTGKTDYKVLRRRLETAQQSA